MIVPIFLPHLGCGDRCIYCDQTFITHVGSGDMAAMVARYLGPVEGSIEVGLYGGNIFGLDPAALTRLFRFFDPYRDKISGFRLSTRPVPLTDETIQIMKENRVTQIELGAPCFNDPILHILNRRHTAADVKESFARLKAQGFQVALQVMVGLPEETMADIVDTADNLLLLAPDYVRVYPLAVLMGTPLETMYREGRFIPLSFEESVTRTAYIYLRCLQRSIKVVKMGLTDNEVIKERVVAGFHHPSFGYVVKSRAFCLAVIARIREKGMRGSITVEVNKKDVPHLVGHKRSNMGSFSKEGVEVAWQTGERREGSFLITYGTDRVEGSVFDALTMIPA
ncbi:MAG TPA: radical SAM protein [Syntrophorhabdaceae bacterium]|jgi:histone acetyltransferase (RNA polymerase elongator complex component)